MYEFYKQIKENYIYFGVLVDKIFPHYGKGFFGGHSFPVFPVWIGKTVKYVYYFQNFRGKERQNLIPRHWLRIVSNTGIQFRMRIELFVLLKTGAIKPITGWIAVIFMVVSGNQTRVSG